MDNIKANGRACLLLPCHHHDAFSLSLSLLVHKALRIGFAFSIIFPINLDVYSDNLVIVIPALTMRSCSARNPQEMGLSQLSRINKLEKFGALAWAKRGRECLD